MYFLVPCSVHNAQLSDRKLPPGPLLQLPFIGDTFNAMREDFWHSLHRRYGPVVSTWIFGSFSVVIADPATVAKLLNSEGELVKGKQCLLAPV
jgi:hypothetical protein